MAMDPYYEWLSIPPEDQPPDHYRLLGLKRFENNTTVIANAADRQLLLVRTYQIGSYADIAQKLMREITSAKLLLLDPASRSAYDRELSRSADTSTAAGTCRGGTGALRRVPPSQPPPVRNSEPSSQPPHVDRGGKVAAARLEIPAVLEGHSRHVAHPEPNGRLGGTGPGSAGVSPLVWLIGGAAVAGLLLVIAVALALRPPAPVFTFRLPLESPIRFREGDLGHASVQIIEHQSWRGKLRYARSRGPSRPR